MDNRRRFSRIVFDYPASLAWPDGTRDVSIVDLSLNGVLLELGADWNGDPEAVYQLEIALSEAARIHMLVTLSHRNGSRGGFACQRIDLDSLAHLRRLTELNLGDPELLQRELGELLAQSSS